MNWVDVGKKITASGAKFSDVVAYYFGSSSGSNEKTRLLNGVKK